MTDTNNTDGAALLPVPCHFCKSGTIATTLHAAGLSWAQVECTNDKCDATGPCRDTEAKAVAAWNALAALSSPLPATQEDAERSEVGSVSMAGLFPRIVTHEQALAAAKNFIDAHFNNPDGKGVLTGIPAREDHDDLVLTDYIKQQRALSDLQRQEYDGEALSDHFPTGLRSELPRTACGMPVPSSGIRTDCYCGWSTLATDEQEARQEWAEHVAAALAHPAQATPSAVSGDAGEGEHSELNADLCARITEYLCAGGLVNPELMDHKAVRELLIDIRDALRAEHRAALPSHQGAGE